MLYQSHLFDVVNELGMNLQGKNQGEAKEIKLITPSVITLM
jgi:hypothetical protein